jgi:hypothetical protein
MTTYIDAYEEDWVDFEESDEEDTTDDSIIDYITAHNQRIAAEQRVARPSYKVNDGGIVRYRDYMEDGW